MRDGGALRVVVSFYERRGAIVKRDYWVWTIGHSNHKWEFFRDLLLSHKIDMVVDTRTYPRSRWAPFAEGRRLRDSLKDIRILYEYRGGGLGGRPRDPQLLDGRGRPDYSKMALRSEFLHDVDLVYDWAREGLRVALLCSEENPDACHRKLLVGEALKEKGVGLVHIRARVDDQVDR